MHLKPIGSNQTELMLSNGICVLFSYSTPVAAVDSKNGTGQILITEEKYSTTTTKHINRWVGTKSHSGKDLRPQSFFDNLVK
jgi:hypothetical protein